MSLLHRELIGLIDEAATRIEPTNYGPWMGQQTVTVASDPTIPSPPTLSASGADQAIDLTISPPTTNTDGSAYKDHKEFEVYYGTTPGIDTTDPATYVGSFVTASTKYTFPATVTHYFRAVAKDKYGNVSSASPEVSATPTATGYEPDIDDYTNNIANVYVGKGIIAVEFQPPKSTWVRWSGWKLYYDVNDGTGWNGTWTHIYTGPGPGFVHKGLNESYAYKYRLSVLGEDGTETTGTVSDNSGSGYTPNASDNSTLIGVTFVAERMIATNEMVARTFIGGVLQSTNWGATKGSKLDLDNEEIILGGSDSPKFHWVGGSTNTLDIVGSVTITGGSGISNLSDAGALATRDTVDSSHLDDGAVTTSKLYDLAVTSAKIDDAAITTAKIADLAVTTAKIDDLAVTNAKIADLAVTNAKISSLDAGKITTGTLDADRIGAHSITADKLNVSTLSAITANMGTLTAGKISVAGGLVKIGENVYGSDDGIYVGSGGTIIIQDASGSTIFDTNSRFQGSRLIDTGIALASNTSQGTLGSSYFRYQDVKTWSSVTVPSGKKWVLVVSPCDNDPQFHHDSMGIGILQNYLLWYAGAFQTSTNSYGGVLSSGTYSNLRVRVYQSCYLKRDDGTSYMDYIDVFWAVWEVPA